LYTLTISTSSSFASSNVYLLGGTTFSFTPPNLQPGTTYYWNVAARNCWQISKISSPTSSFTTAP
jgi:hypothetical protein